MLTTPQLTALKAAIDADLLLAAEPLNSDGYFNIALALNSQVATPDFYVWKSSVSIAEIMGNGFDWTRVDNMTVGESRIWEYMTQLGTLNPSQANVRAGVNEAFKGTAQDTTMRQAIFGHCQKLATRAQRIFASGAGTSSTDAGVGPGVMAVEQVSSVDIEMARTLP